MLQRDIIDWPCRRKAKHCTRARTFRMRIACKCFAPTISFMESYENATPSLGLARVCVAARGMYVRPMANAAEPTAALCASQVTLGCAGHAALPADRAALARRGHERPLDGGNPG